MLFFYDFYQPGLIFSVFRNFEKILDTFDSLDFTMTFSAIAGFTLVAGSWGGGVHDLRIDGGLTPSSESFPLLITDNFRNTLFYDEFWPKTDPPKGC